MFRVLWTPTVAAWALSFVGWQSQVTWVAVIVLAVVVACLPRRFLLRTLIGRMQDACARLGWHKLHDALADLCKFTTGDFVRWYSR